MISKLMRISELGKLLDYSDMRSTKTWCNKHNIPIMYAGKTCYVPSPLVDLYFQQYVEKYFNGKQNSSDILEAIDTDDYARLSELMNVQVTAEVKNKSRAKKKHSKAAEEFLNKLNRV